MRDPSSIDHGMLGDTATDTVVDTATCIGQDIEEDIERDIEEDIEEVVSRKWLELDIEEVECKMVVPIGEDMDVDIDSDSSPVVLEHIVQIHLELRPHERLHK